MLKHLVLSGTVGATLVLGACATGPEPVATAHMPGQLEAIHAAAFTRDTAVFRVSSNGCTDKDDVKPFITKLRSRAVITLRRLEEDSCHNTRADGVLLKWSFDELGLEPGAEVEVNNPYILPQAAS